MIRLEKNRSYKFALMPNINGENDIERLSFNCGDFKNINYVFFCYVFFEGRLDVLKFGRSLKSSIRNFLNGHVSNSKGNLIITFEEDVFKLPKKYFINKDGTQISLNDGYKEDGFREMTDIFYNSPLDLFDPTSGLFLEFDTIEDSAHNFLKIVRTRITDGKPLFKNDEYLTMYDYVPTLQEAKELRIKGLSKVLQNFEVCE